MPSHVCAIFVVDISESVDADARDAATKFIADALRHKAPDDLAGIIVFGRQPIVEIAPSDLRRLPPFHAAPDRTATDIASALRLAMGLFPDGFARRIVLLSDGNETEGDSLAVAQVAKSEGIPIDVVPLSTRRVVKEVLVTDVLMPTEAKRGQPFSARVLIDATTDATGVLRVDRDGVPVKEVPVRLTKGKNAVTVSLRVDREGVHRFRFLLEAAPDADPRNNVGLGMVKVLGKPKVLLAEGNLDPSGALAKALSANGIEVVRVSEGQLPARPEEWQGYDAVLLSDYPAWGMSEGQMGLLRRLVADSGVGFGMLGGEKGFLSGGYYGTAVAEVLPVDLDVRQRKIYPAATIVLIMDTSGSMAAMEDGVQKVHLAAKAAMETLKMLRPMDRFGVIVSGTGADWLAPIQPARNRDRIIQQIGRIYAGGGGIYCRPSLELAAKAIVAEVTQARHIIMLADTDDCDEQEGCFEIARQLRAHGVTVTTVGFGRPDGIHAPFLRQLAAIGGGNFYVARSLKDLPKLFTADVSLMTRRAIEEGAFIPKVVGDDEVLREVDWSKVPPLLAYNVTSDKPLARTLMRTEKGDPLLAVGQYGLGAVMAWTSDGKAKWAREWVRWGEFGKFWGNLVRSLLRRATQGRYTVTVRVNKGVADIEMEAADEKGEPLNLLEPQVRVTDPTGETRTVLMQQEGLGRYRGRMPVSQTGVYFVSVVEPSAQGKARVYTTGFALAYPTEYRFLRANLPLLTRLAELTGGQVNPLAKEVFQLPSQPLAAATDVWQWCVVAALVLLLMDIAVRRLVIGVPEVVAALQGKLVGWWTRRRQRVVVAPATTERLRLAKERSLLRRRQGVREAIGEIPTQPTVPDQAPEPAGAAPTVSPAPSEPRPVAPSDGGAARATERLLTVKRRRRSDQSPPKA
jgi:Mg-chelatase subunit ChlD